MGLKVSFLFHFFAENRLLLCPSSQPPSNFLFLSLHLEMEIQRNKEKAREMKEGGREFPQPFE